MCMKLFQIQHVHCCHFPPTQSLARELSEADSSMWWIGRAKVHFSSGSGVKGRHGPRLGGNAHVHRLPFHWSNEGRSRDHRLPGARWLGSAEKGSEAPWSSSGDPQPLSEGVGTTQQTSRGRTATGRCCKCEHVMIIMSIVIMTSAEYYHIAGNIGRN